MKIVNKTSSELILYDHGYLSLIVGGAFIISGLLVGILMYQYSFPFGLLMFIFSGVFAILLTKFITIKIDKITELITISYAGIGKKIIQHVPFNQIESVGIEEHLNNGYTLSLFIILKSNEYYLFNLGYLSKYSRDTAQEVAKFLGIQLADYTDDIGGVIRGRKQIGVPILKERPPTFYKET